MQILVRVNCNSYPSIWGYITDTPIRIFFAERLPIGTINITENNKNCCTYSLFLGSLCKKILQRGVNDTSQG